MINRHDPDYHRATLTRRSDDDLAASILLALNYSRRTKQTSVSQGLIQMDCVALCYCPEGLWVASNTRKISDDDLETLRTFLCDQNIDIYVVVNGSGGMHAEMQLLKELLEVYTKGQIQELGLRMGVSKACCGRCADKLREYSISFTEEHDSPVVNWESPD